MGTNLEPTRLRIDALTLRVSDLERKVESLIKAMHSMVTHIKELENDFDDHVDEELMNKLDYSR